MKINKQILLAIGIISFVVIGTIVYIIFNKTTGQPEALENTVPFVETLQEEDAGGN
jgi:hypothetical protein